MKISAQIVNRDRFCLQVKQYRLWLQVGVTEAERRLPQPIAVDIDISWPEPPVATETDVLTDTICYGTLVETLRTVAEAKPFRLLEHLAGVLGQAAEDFILHKGHSAHVTIAVTKVVPPVPGILGGVTVTWQSSRQQ